MRSVRMLVCFIYSQSCTCNSFCLAVFFMEIRPNWKLEGKKKGRGEWGREKEGKRERESCSCLFQALCYKIASWVWMKFLGPHLVQPRPPACAGEKRSLALLLPRQSAMDPHTLIQQSHLFKHLPLSFHLVKGFYCSLFCITILLFSPSDIKL